VEIVAERITYLSSPNRKDQESRFDDESSFWAFIFLYHLIYIYIFDTI
jgi:hypothetical protein